MQWLDGSAVTSAQLTTLVKSLAVAAGASPALFSSHSLRSGGVCAALACGQGEAVAMREGRWASLNSLKHYIRLASTAGIFGSNALSSTFVPHIDPLRVRTARPRRTSR